MQPTAQETLGRMSASPSASPPESGKLTTNDSSAAPTAAAATTGAAEADAAATATATGAEDSQGKPDEKADQAADTAATPKGGRHEQGEEEHENGPTLDRISPERVRELIEVGSATQENFRELIRFVGWRLSDPYCVSRSFALRPACSPPPPGVPPQRTCVASATADADACGDGVDKDGQKAPESAKRVEESGAGGGQQPRPLPSDGESLAGDDDDGVAAATAAFAALRLVGAEEEVSPRPPSSPSTTTAAARPGGPSLGEKEETSAGPSLAEKEEPPAAPTVPLDTPGGAGEREWTDGSSVGMDIRAVSEMWKLLVQLDVEGVHNTVLNALDSLTQGLLVATFLDREASGEATTAAAAGVGAASAVALAAASSAGAGGTNREGGSEDGVGGRDTEEFYKEKAEMRSIILVLEHPEIQDPDFEAVLHTLFKLAMRLPASRRDELCSFFEGVEEQRFTRYLGAVQQFVTLRLFVGGCSASVLPAVQFIHLLYLANQKARKVKDEAFYNEAINSELMPHRPTLVDNYIEWRQDHLQPGPAQFKSLISFGEVLDPASKSAVLSLDSQVQMRGTINNEVQEAMFGGVRSFGATVSPYLKLKVRRSHIVADSLLALVMLAEEDLKKPLKVTFVGEEGVDEGGVQKEYFQVMLRELLDPKYSMLKYDEETRRLWFNSDSLEAQEEFELVGMLLGIAIYNGIILDVPFPLVVYKLVMGGTPTLEDLKQAQPAVGRGLQQLLDFEGDVESTFSRTFQISYEVFGAVKTFDLKEGGGETVVTRDNRKEYVDLYVSWLLVESVKGQYGPFERGFHKVVGGKALSLFRPDELELLICGNPKLDFSALEENSEYQDGYSRDNNVVKNFWEVVHEFGEDSKRKLLKFATGSDRAPIQGLGSSALSLVISKNGGDSDRLPTAHTCFNHLLLPSYSTKDKLRDRLNLAIEQSEGFGLR